MTFAANTSSLATRTKQDMRVVHEAINGIATVAGHDTTTLPLATLATTDKTSLIAAINEITATSTAAAVINDAATNTTQAWSSSKIAGDIAALINDAAASATTTYSSTKIAADLAGLINDAAASATTTYSGNKIDADIATAVSNLVNASPAALDTLNELATALGNDPNFATTINNAIALKANSADVYTQAQLYTQTELGDPTTDFVAVYDAA